MQRRPLSTLLKHKPPKKILVIITRRIGDVLLTTPLIHTLKAAWQKSEVDVLVFENTRDILANHPDIHQVIAMPNGSSKLAKLKWQLSLWRKYDLAISTLTSDRATFFAWLAGKYRIGLLEVKSNKNWKKLLLNEWVMFDNTNTHTVSMVLKLASQLGLSPIYEVSAHWTAQDSQWVDALTTQPYAVLHTYPKFAYKMWHSTAWVELVAWLYAQNMHVILTGSSDPDEMRYIAQLLEKLPSNTLNFAGKLNFCQMAYLLKKASIYVGPDTVATHLAAAVGAPTVALFGPSNPVKWGPWPKDYYQESSPWKMVGATQQMNNVILLQGIQPKSLAPCVPCLLEGCDRNIHSRSLCLDELPASRVIAAINTLLAK